MEKKSNKILPGILMSNFSEYTINPSLHGISASLFDYNDINTQYCSEYPAPERDIYYDDDFEYAYDEEVEEILTNFDDLDDYIKEATVQTVSIIKRNILERLKNYEILAFDIQDNDENIIFFIKTINDENKEKFILLRLSCDYEIDMRLFMISMLDCKEFRYYGRYSSGLYGFHMKDSLLQYEFELLNYTNLNTISSTDPNLSIVNEGAYFVIKNNLGDPIVFTQLRYPDDIAIFNEALTKADPQAGLLFSLSYNANK